VQRHASRTEQDGPDLQAAARRLRARAEREKRRQLAVARRDVEDRHHEALEQLADQLVAGLLSRPQAALALAEEREDDELAEILLALYDLKS
jgi:glutamyl-tRNA reductase